MTTDLGAATRFVGQRLPRREDLRLLSGRGRFVDDVDEHDMLHVAFVRSDVPRGTITSVDVTEAAALDGVVAVLTAGDLNPLVQASWVDYSGPAGELPFFRVLADGDVRFVGEPIALVVATSRYIAEDACELVAVDIEPLPAIVDVDAALADDAPLVHRELPSNVAGANAPADDPELEAAFAGAAHVITRTYDQQRYVCVPMETRGVIARWEPRSERMDLRISTQGPHGVRSFVARALGIAENNVRVIMDDVGGGFGQKMFMIPDELAVVLTSRLVPGPLKWIEDRRENLVAGLHARDDRMTYSMAVDADGHILAVRASLIEDMGAFPAAGSSSAGFVGALVTGPYDIPRAVFSSQAVYTNTCGRGSYRGPWMMETYAREQMMDDAARELGLDPLELRRRNVIQPDDLPYTMAMGRTLEGVSIAASLEQAAEMIDYDAFRDEQARARDDGRLLGIGIGLYVEPSGIAYGTLASEAATVSITSTGGVLVAMSSASHGQSVETTAAQVAADELGVPFDTVTIVQGDTMATPYGQGTGGSRSAVLCSGAVRGAATQVRDKVLDIAAHQLEAAREDLVIEDGTVAVVGSPSSGISMAAIARIAYAQPDLLPEGMAMGLEAQSRFTPSSPVTWSNSCHVCTCEIDPRTGAVTLLRFVVSEDCGVMINPMVVEGQIAGGVVQGIGGALYEHMVYDDTGTPVTTSFADYLLPTAAEVPDIEFGHIVTPATSNAGGHKGMGEGGAIGAPPAVLNAVADALAHIGPRLPRQATPAAIAGLLAAAGR